MRIYTFFLLFCLNKKRVQYFFIIFTFLYEICITVNIRKCHPLEFSSQTKKMEKTSDYHPMKTKILFLPGWYSKIIQNRPFSFLLENFQILINSWHFYYTGTFMETSYESNKFSEKFWVLIIIIRIHSNYIKVKDVSSNEIQKKNPKKLSKKKKITKKSQKASFFKFPSLSI